MKKTLLLLASLGSFAVLGEAAAAGNPDPGLLRPPASFGVRIFVDPAPNILRHHHHPGARQLRPQPVFRFADSRRHFWRPAPGRHFGHLPPRPHFRHLPVPHVGHFRPRPVFRHLPPPRFGHLPSRPHFGHLPPWPRFGQRTPGSGWRQPWHRLPHHVVRPPHRDDAWRHGGRQWHSWPGRDFADRQWQHRPGAHLRHRDGQGGRHHMGRGGRRH